MAVLLTNGAYYIAHSKTGAVIKVSDISQAQDFHSIEKAAAQKKKAPGKCASYFYMDTDKVEAEPAAESEPVKKEKNPKTKRKTFPKRNGCLSIRRQRDIAICAGNLLNLILSRLSIMCRFPKAGQTIWATFSVAVTAATA